MAFSCRTRNFCSSCQAQRSVLFAEKLAAGITRNRFGDGTLTYEGTAVSDRLQHQNVLDVLRETGLTGPDQQLPSTVRVKHGVNNKGRLILNCINYSSESAMLTYHYGAGSDLLTRNSLMRGQKVTVGPWDLILVEENN